ncbi:MAG TPA: hypothetical protein DGC76_00235 [Candidatus Accumulibacter sp.]|nr:hypothetical protein [Accumulibacter sp.]
MFLEAEAMAEEGRLLAYHLGPGFFGGRPMIGLPARARRRTLAAWVGYDMALHVYALRTRWRDARRLPRSAALRGGCAGRQSALSDVVAGALPRRRKLAANVPPPGSSAGTGWT